MAERRAMPRLIGRPKLWQALYPLLALLTLATLLAGPQHAAHAAAVSHPDAGTHAASIAPPADLDEHVNRLSAELRCLVCQNQTIADSQAELATQLKREVRQQLARGATDDEVRGFMVARYGDFVLYRPPVKPLTWLLWAGPALLLAFGLTLFAWQAGRRRTNSDAALETDPDPDADADADADDGAGSSPHSPDPLHEAFHP